MSKQEKHDYLIALIKELEKAGNETNLNNFIIVTEDLLKVKYRLRNYFDYPISAAEYDTLITYAENLLGVNRFGSADDPHYEHLKGIKYDQPMPPSSGRTNDATSVDSAQSNDDIVNDAIVDYALIDMKFVDYILKNYTPDQLTIDIVLEAAEKGLPVDGMKVNIQTAKHLKFRIKQEQDLQALNNSIKRLDEKIDEFSSTLNADTIKALEEAANADPKNLMTWEELKKDVYGDENNPDYKKYWGSGNDILFFYASDYVNAWKCADIWHKDIYYWPYNEQYIVGQVNPIEWYKTKGDEAEWGPIFGPFNTPEELDEWVVGFWKWWHKLSDENKFIYHNIPKLDNKWFLWNTNYIEMFRRYAAKDPWNTWDYNKIAAEAKNDDYMKKMNDDYNKNLDEFYGVYPKAFSEEWNKQVADLVGQIKTIESKLDTSQNPFDGEIIQKLEQDLLNLLKWTL